MVMLILQENMKCSHGLMRRIWEMINLFPDAKQIKKSPKTVLCKECTYVEKDRNESDKSFHSPPDNEHNFSSSYFHEEPIFNV